jgi:phage terminase large subunit
VIGSHNYNSLIGSSPAGVVFSEWATADPHAWDFIRPILFANNGFALFISTPRGSNHARKMYDLARLEPARWFCQTLTTADTGIFDADGLAGELREMQHSLGEEEGRALFEQEYNCSWESAMVGSYYGSYLARAAAEGRIGRVPIDAAVQVHTAWDLGVSDSTAVWFIQCVGKERRLIDYHEGSGVGLDEYARVLAEKAQRHRILYGKHYFPHDIAVRELGGGGLSRAQTMRGLGITPTIVAQSSVADGINATRRLLDAAWIDEVRCERGLNALRNYRRAWNDKTKMFSDAPLHDWSSHGADALRTFASGFRDPKQPHTASLDAPRTVGGVHERNTAWMARR